MRSGHANGGLIVAEASGQLSCFVRVLVAVDVLTAPIASGGRSLTVRTRGVQATQQAYVDAAHCTVKYIHYYNPSSNLIVPFPWPEFLSCPFTRRSLKKT